MTKTKMLGYFVMIGALVAAMACGRETAAPAAPPQKAAAETHAEEENAIHLDEDVVRDLRISTARVTERAGAAEVTLLGEVAADQARYAEVVPPAAAQIVEVLVETNAAVRRGTPLARMRSPELGRARADLISARARHEFARETLERKRGLASERLVALREVQEAEAVFRAAEADVRAATASLQALGVGDDPGGDDSSLFLLRAPIAGRVIERRAVLGQYAEPNVALFTIADLMVVWVVANAFEREAVNIEVGTTAHVTLAALPGQAFDGPVALVGRLVDAGSRTLPVRIELANPTGVMRPGMSASARVEVAGERRVILTVPAAALQRVGDEWLAFLPKGASEFEMRRVGRGRDVGIEVEVVSGLRAGDTVVVDGAFLLKAEAEKRRVGGAAEHAH